MSEKNVHCKINDTTYNLQEVQKLLLEKREWDAKEKIVQIVGCDYHTATNILSQIKDYNNQIPSFINPDLRIKIEQQNKQPVIKCPVCGGLSIRRISSGEKWVITLLGGRHDRTVWSQFECEHCGFMW